MKQLFYVVLLCTTIHANAQDVLFARKIVDTLTSKYFWGRGYTNNGMANAAMYLQNQFKQYGLKPFNGKSYLQPFTYPVNTFPGNMQVAVNGRQLTPGKDFIVSADSKGFVGKINLVKKDSTHYINEEHRVVAALENKLTWSVSSHAEDITTIKIDHKAITEDIAEVEILIENKVNTLFKANNVGGIIKGKRKPDSLVVFTAHYDHLGGMGAKTYFAGANDNASGIAMLLGLAKYYAAYPPDYSVAFVCFAGEEAGLIGSRYFTEHPLWNLKNTRFVTNVDLVGTGIDGITVVNGTAYKAEFEILTEINNRDQYLVKINARGKAANSDHYWFSEKGIPSFFIYTLGGIGAYHDVYDVAATLPLTEYEDLFQLIVKFNARLMEGN